MAWQLYYESYETKVRENVQIPVPDAEAHDNGIHLRTQRRSTSNFRERG
jgi:hypothetical protein